MSPAIPHTSPADNPELVPSILAEDAFTLSMIPLTLERFHPLMLPLIPTRGLAGSMLSAGFGASGLTLGFPPPAGPRSGPDTPAPCPPASALPRSSALGSSRKF